jgi:hypothetical protein
MREMEVLSFCQEPNEVVVAKRRNSIYLDKKHEYAPIEAIGVEHTLEMRNPPWA